MPKKKRLAYGEDIMNLSFWRKDIQSRIKNGDVLPGEIEEYNDTVAQVHHLQEELRNNKLQEEKANTKTPKQIAAAEKAANKMAEQLIKEEEAAQKKLQKSQKNKSKQKGPIKKNSFLPNESTVVAIHVSPEHQTDSPQENLVQISPVIGNTQPEASEVTSSPQKISEEKSKAQTENIAATPKLSAEELESKIKEFKFTTLSPQQIAVYQKITKKREDLTPGENLIASPSETKSPNNKLPDKELITEQLSFVEKLMARGAEKTAEKFVR